LSSGLVVELGGVSGDSSAVAVDGRAPSLAEVLLHEIVGAAWRNARPQLLPLWASNQVDGSCAIADVAASADDSPATGLATVVKGVVNVPRVPTCTIFGTLVKLSVTDRKIVWNRRQRR
jgi:hypothetical protein